MDVDYAMQAALLFTNTSGQRRIRVHTLALPITDNVSSVFKVRVGLHRSPVGAGPVWQAKPLVTWDIGSHGV